MKIDNKDLNIFIKGPSVQETLMYLLLILKPLKEKVRIIDSAQVWDYYTKNNSLDDCIVISTFYDEIENRERGVPSIANCVNIFLSNQMTLDVNVIELKNRLSDLTEIKFREYTNLDYNMINEVISKTYNLFSYYKKELLSKNFTSGLSNHIKSVRQGEIIPMLLFPISIEKNYMKTLILLTKFLENNSLIYISIEIANMS